MSQERAASMFRVNEYAERNRLRSWFASVTIIKDTAGYLFCPEYKGSHVIPPCYSETSVNIYQTTEHHIFIITAVRTSSTYIRVMRLVFSKSDVIMKCGINV
jgi:hypothetical protein